jgi:hypothetical protein
MNLGCFLRVDQETAQGERHFIIHKADPPFSIEVEADFDKSGRMRNCTLKRLCLPNSWTGDYTKYARLVNAALAFFEQSCRDGDPIPRF